MFQAALTRRNFLRQAPATAAAAAVAAKLPPGELSAQTHAAATTHPMAAADSVMNIDLGGSGLTRAACRALGVVPEWKMQEWREQAKYATHPVASVAVLVSVSPIMKMHFSGSRQIKELEQNYLAPDCREAERKDFLDKAASGLFGDLTKYLRT